MYSSQFFKGVGSFAEIFTELPCVSLNEYGHVVAPVEHSRPAFFEECLNLAFRRISCEENQPLWACFCGWQEHAAQ
jgi:hypothetical protein